ncbi:unnamed protein product [Paramecium sonneborni]|uniref:Uncharacterized protein n=1 Tax=Paramecium sonneborni TaxID=65129 RepID=A0A8S1Q239_9CILI|nr:unnamed protein product [Paramecium sonneborni]
MIFAKFITIQINFFKLIRQLFISINIQFCSNQYNKNISSIQQTILSIPFNQIRYSLITLKIKLQEEQKKLNE